MLVSGIKSKPIYAPLRADPRGLYHLMVGADPGGAALLRVLEELSSEAPAVRRHTQVMYVLPAGGVSVAHRTGAAHSTEPSPSTGPAQVTNDAIDRFSSIGVSDVRAFNATGELLDALRTVLDASLMGTRLYVAGPESFIGLVMKLALEFDLSKDEIRAEEMGSSARRVYCVHCRATAEDVRTNIVRCNGCARWLLVRDHYSRRLAAYMGVMVDAEAPGELPPLKEVFR